MASPAAREQGPTDRAEATARLARIGQGPADGFDLAEAALMLAALERPRVALGRYRAHLRELADAVAERSGSTRRRETGTAGHRSLALAAVVAGDFGYHGDDLTYDDLQNANLIRVIDRRKGLPVALGILYIHAARAQGWHAYGLNFPGHFLVAVTASADRAIIDPFAGTLVRGASDLRAMLKAVTGMAAELTPACYAPLPDRGVLLRLQNNIKARLAAQRHFADAAAAAERMLLLAPDEASLHRDIGLYQAESGNLKAAVTALSEFVARAPDGRERHEAAALIQALRARLN